MSQAADAAPRVPHFSMFRVVLAGIILYVLLTVFLMIFVWWKSAALAGMAAQTGGSLTPLAFELSVRSFVAFTMHMPTGRLARRTRDRGLGHLRPRQL